MSDGVTRLISQFVEMKEEVNAAEVAAFLITQARADWSLSDDETYKASEVGPTLLWRGATSYARDIIKRPAVVEAVLDEAQGEMFEGLSAFVGVGQDVDGDWKFKRRRSLTRDEYARSLDLLREKARHLSAKIERYQAEYDKASPFWSAGMTFGEAFAAASAAD